MNDNSSFTLMLKLNTNKNDLIWLDKIFFHGNHLYNVCVKEAIKRINKFKEDPIVNNIFKEYFRTKKLTNEQKKILKDKRAQYQIDNKYCLEKYLNVCRKKYANYIDADTCSKISLRVYDSIEKFLFKKGKKIHFKKYKDFCSIASKTNKQGIKFRNNEIIYQGRHFPIIIKDNDEYAKECFLDEFGFERKIKFCRIKRKWHKHNYCYYAEIVFEGTPPKKDRTMGKGNVGIDIGTSTIAAVGDNNIIFKELDDGINKIDSEIKRLNRKVDRQRRANNPDNYNPDGTIRRNTKTFKKKWVVSKNQKLTYDKIKTLYKKRSTKLEYFQNLLSNEILTLGSDIKIENMSFQGLQKRAKKTEKNSNGKFKKKKRFGKSIQIHAPSALIEKVITKARYFGNIVTKINTTSVKASQLNHITGEYKKAELNQRWKHLDKDINIQRDLYSAYLIKNVNEDNKTINIEDCIKGFDNFFKLHNDLIKTLKNEKKEGKLFPSCMGI